MSALATGSAYAVARGEKVGAFTDRPGDPSREPHVRLSVWGPRGGWKDGTELLPAAARALADELRNAADRAEGVVATSHDGTVGPLMEEIVLALADRGYDEDHVRHRVDVVGEQELWDDYVGPMLDRLELNFEEDGS